MNLRKKVFVDVSEFLTLRAKVDSFQIKTVLMTIQEPENDYLFIDIRLFYFNEFNAFQHQKRSQIYVLGLKYSDFLD